MSDDALAEMEKAILRRVSVWMVVGGVAIGGVGGSGIIRYDKFGASDAKLMQERLELKIDRMQLECDEKINKSDSTKPPGLTRQRITELEACARSVCEGYHTPTYEWR